MDTKPTTPHVLILAGGEGTRLRTLTRALSGDDRPKQFCALIGRESLLEDTRRRAAMLVPDEQTFLVLMRHHEPYYQDIVSDAPPSSLVIQPENRGTATAVLYGLLRIALRAPNAPVIILPSDHWVSNDAYFMLHAAAAVGVVEAHENLVILLGITPTRPEPEYGWIERSEPIIDSWREIHRVRRFIEKPAPELALALHGAGTSFWNSSVVIGQVEALLFLFAMARPDLVDSFLSIWRTLGSPSESAAVERLYRTLPAADFSQDILAARPEALAVLSVSGVAWEDLGHPRRILDARRHAALRRADAQRARAPKARHSRSA
jgi:mannose-1-phosphate guanylyltransferase